MKQRDDPFAWGDESKSQWLVIDGKPIGHFVVVRKGRRVFMTIISGVYFDEPGALVLLTALFDRHVTTLFHDAVSAVDRIALLREIA